METKINKTILSIISLCLFLWLAGILLAPILASSNSKTSSFLSSILYFIYQPVCHQLTERSFIVDHIPMAVCIRCFAVYLSGWILSIFYLCSTKISLWPLRRYLILTIPTLIDFGFEKMLIYSNIGLFRFGTGLLLGIVIFQLFILSIASSENNPQIKSIKI